jgi:hypothetical protein
MFKVLISLIVVAVIAIALSRRMRLSPKYERKPRVLNEWSSLDKGIDPTEESR